MKLREIIVTEESNYGSNDLSILVTYFLQVIDYLGSSLGFSNDASTFLECKDEC